MWRVALKPPLRRLNAAGVGEGGRCRAHCYAATFSSAADAPHRVDVAVVGGGVVGSVLAAQIAEPLAAAGRRVALLEVNAPKPLADVAGVEGPDLRVFAITPASASVLEASGVWGAIQGVRAAPFGSMQVWDAHGEGHVSFGDAAGSPDAEPLGYVVENRVLQSSLFDRLRDLEASGHLEIICPASVKAVQAPRQHSDPPRPASHIGGDKGPAIEDELVRIELADGRVLETQLVVAADGAASGVRNMCGIGTWGWDYDQRGLVATVRTADANHTAWQRFLPHGPVAVLPLWDNLSSIVWSTTPKHAAELAALPPDEFVASLNAALHAPSAAARAEGPSASGFPLLAPLEVAAAAVTDVMGSLSQARAPARPAPVIESVEGVRASFPLRLMHANSFVRHRAALVGDAAHVTHPLAGQGLNLGIADAAALADILTEAAELGLDLGELSLLTQYEQRRKPETVAMLGALDTIKRLFSGEPGVMSAARNAGMSVLNNIDPVKRFVAGYAMGSGVGGIDLGSILRQPFK